ncbi:MAG: DUF4143 domain-containing protein [Candidatus Odinarchaeota archaeon]|nr:DUF4143 domain-containing protein [Candidatus Odinarchaeota archaeon]
MFFLKKFLCSFYVEYLSYAAKKRLLKPRKVYVVDVGLYNALLKPPTLSYGHIAENPIFLHLKRFTDKIHYWQDEKGHEIDFIADINGTLYAIESKIEDTQSNNVLNTSP